MPFISAAFCGAFPCLHALVFGHQMHRMPCLLKANSAPVLCKRCTTEGINNQTLHAVAENETGRYAEKRKSMNPLFGPHMYKNSSDIGFPWLVCEPQERVGNRCSAVHHTTVIMCIRWPRFRVGDASSDPLRIELLL